MSMERTELTPELSDRLALAYRLHRLRRLSRNAAILELVEAGETLQRVAVAFGLTRERVRQVARDEAIRQGVQSTSPCRGCAHELLARTATARSASTARAALSSHVQASG